jgi:dihydroorotase
VNVSLVIRNGRVIDPAQGLDQTADLLIADGKVAAISPPDGGAQWPAARRTIDATGRLVCPGLIDMHVHLREPGNEESETIATGAAAAVAGGFTGIACMPNTSPAIDNEAMIEFVYRQAARAGLCRVYPIGAITRGRAGRELAEMGQMVRAGAVAFSDDGCGVADAAVMFRAMQYAAMFDRPLIQHCEDPALAEGGCMNAGKTSLRLGLPGIPAMAEEMMIQRDLLLARNVPCRYHVAHISTAGAVALVREARARGVSVTAEVCPHHLLLSDELLDGYDTSYKVNPPLRSAADVEACIAGVIDGTIDCLATDHAPHDRAAKEVDFQSAPSGIVGLEVALGLFVKALVRPGHLTWPGLIERMATRPAGVLGLPGGNLRPGTPADVTIIDPEAEWEVDASTFRSRSRNCPYDGWNMTCKVIYTLVGGEVKYSANTENAAVAGAAG